MISTAFSPERLVMDNIKEDKQQQIDCSANRYISLYWYHRYLYSCSLNHDAVFIVIERFYSIWANSYFLLKLNF